jgi:hypothetical protein
MRGGIRTGDDTPGRTLQCGGATDPIGSAPKRRRARNLRAEDAQSVVTSWMTATTARRTRGTSG